MEVYWWLTQYTAVTTTRTIKQRIAQASTLLSALRTLVEFPIALPLVVVMGMHYTHSS
jgi:hypothetical protein